MSLFNSGFRLYWQFNAYYSKINNLYACINKLYCFLSFRLVVPVSLECHSYQKNIYIMSVSSSPLHWRGRRWFGQLTCSSFMLGMPPLWHLNLYFELIWLEISNFPSHSLLLIWSILITWISWSILTGLTIYGKLFVLHCYGLTFRLFLMYGSGQKLFSKQLVLC